VPLRFETAGDAVCGIELSAGGQKLAWTIDEYLRDLQHKVAALLVPAARPAAKPAAAPKHPDAKDAGAAPAPDADAVAP
jgi:F-type H+-transporting ATPase subunit b